MSLLSPQLNAFMAIVKAKTVHSAADILHITQTAVTQRLRNLETQLKTTLFVRSRRGMLLTPQGEALLRYCQAARALEGEALANIQGTSAFSTVTVNMLAPSSIMRARIIPSLLPVMARYKNLLMRFTISDAGNPRQSLHAGECEFAILTEEQLAAEMMYKALAPENYILVCSSKWKGRSLEKIITEERIVDYDPSDEMTYRYLKAFNLFENSSKDRYFVNQTESLAAIVVEGLAYTVLTTEFAKPFIDRGELIALHQKNILTYQSILAWYARPEPPNYFEAIIDAIT